MDSESSERRQRNIAGWRQSFRELCCSSNNTKQAAEESIKPPQSDIDGWESEEARLRGTLAKWQASYIDIMNEKDELSAQPKWRFQWKHNKRLQQLEGEMVRVLELIKRSEQEISKGCSSASATVNNNQSDGLELPTYGYLFISKYMKRAACQMLVALEDQEVHLIGLVGLRGVGKTTLAKLVAHKAQRSRLFDLVLVIDSHSRERFEPDGDKIWHRMAVLLGVEGTPQSAKSRLNQKLDEGNKMLIILDDVWWKKPDLDALEGIPYGQRCKIIVITCLPQVCAGVGCHATIQLNGLTIQETRKWYEHIPLAIYPDMQPMFPTFVSFFGGLAKKKLGNWEK